MGTPPCATHAPVSLRSALLPTRAPCSPRTWSSRSRPPRTCVSETDVTGQHTAPACGKGRSHLPSPPRAVRWPDRARTRRPPTSARSCPSAADPQARRRPHARRRRAEAQRLLPRGTEPHLRQTLPTTLHKKIPQIPLTRNTTCPLKKPKLSFLPKALALPSAQRTGFALTRPGRPCLRDLPGAVLPAPRGAQDGP